MSAGQLLAALKDTWPKVRTVPDWETRGRAWRQGKPIGVMEHHTAPPVPYPVDRLYGSLLKCNINTKPDGTIWLVAYEACNYSSGLGSSVVHREVLAGIAPERNAKERGLTDDTNGNPLFWNLENDHPGDGSPIPDIQHEAVVVATRVVNDHFDLVPNQTISHAEWTWRKRDPYWNGDLRAIEAIRTQLEDTMRVTEFVEGLAADPTRIDQLIAEGVIGGDRNYWKTGQGSQDPTFKGLATPGHHVWKNFVNAFEVQTALNAAAAAKGGGGAARPMAIKLTGIAEPN